MKQFRPKFTDKTCFGQLYICNHDNHTLKIKNHCPRCSENFICYFWVEHCPKLEDENRVGKFSAKTEFDKIGPWCLPSTASDSVDDDDGDDLLSVTATHFVSTINLGELWPPSRILSMILTSFNRFCRFPRRGRAIVLGP
jgi:hypothetical protein